MLFSYKKTIKISLLSVLFLVYSCDTEILDNKNINVQIKSSQNINSKYFIQGQTELNSNGFNIKAVPDIAVRATISLIYPSDYSNIALREATVATGLSDSSGFFTINPGFTPQVNQVMILESAKRSKGVGYSALSLRTHIRWNGSQWESITGTTILINTRTTAMALVSSLETGVLNSAQTINRISYSGTKANISYDSTFTNAIYNKYYGGVLTALASSIDPVKFYNDANYISAQDRAKLSSVRANMHTLQTIVETYAVDWGGVYADNFEMLKNEAKEKGYWKSFKNPFDPSINAPVALDNSDYNTARNTLQYKGQDIEDIIFFRGAVTYEAKVINGSVTSYVIYGINEIGEYLQDRGTNFYLSNQ